MRKYYVGGPYMDGTHAICELGTGRMIRKFHGPDDVQEALEELVELSGLMGLVPTITEVPLPPLRMRHNELKVEVRRRFLREGEQFLPRVKNPSAE